MKETLESPKLKLKDFKNSLSPIEQVLEQELAQDPTYRIYQQFERNPLLWARYYFPHHFRSQSPNFHLEIISECLSNDYLAVAAPRESAKSTLLLFAYQFHRIVFKKKRFVVIVSNTFSKASMALDAIKKEIKENERLTDFHIEIVKDAEGDSIIRHNDGFETRIICKGAEQIGSIRGVKFGAYRPDLIIIDDVEDDVMVKSVERRLDLQRQFDEALMPAGERSNCQYIAIGTILHDDSLLAKLVSKDYYTEWKKLFYRGLNQIKETKEYVSLWDEKWTVEQLFKIMRENPSVFAKEIQNDPVTGSRARFKREQFKYWEILDNQYCLYNESGMITNKGYLIDCKAAIACDLAWSERRDADSTVIMPGFLTPTNDLMVEYYIQKKGMRPDEFAENLFTMEARLRTLTRSKVPIGFEKAMLEKVTHWILRNEMRRRNNWLLTKELSWESDKVTRIETVLQPRYAQGVVYHRKNMGDLEYQLLRFPSGAYDDLIDAEQGLARLLEFPKILKKKKARIEDEGFMQLRKIAIEHNKRINNLEKRPFNFGSKRKNYSPIPSVKTFR